MAGTSATASSGQARRTLVVVGPADELRRCARAGAVLAGALANRARGAAEELLSGSRPAGWGGLGRAEDLADEGRQAAAEVLGTLRRELSGLLGHMEHLEQSLRGPRAADVGPPPVPPRPAAPGPAPPGPALGLAPPRSGQPGPAPLGRVLPGPPPTRPGPTGPGPTGPAPPGPARARGQAARGGAELAAGRRRLDVELVRRGLAASRAEGASLIAGGRVLVSGSVAQKPAHQVSASEPIVLAGPPARFVSRGGEKLDAALGHFGVLVAGREVLDAGASTGGFTDCLLQRGAKLVVAVDVGHGQLHPRLRADPRVEVMERVNVRHLGPAALGGRRFELVTADLSFISLKTVAPALSSVAKPGADLVVLVKPQFEAGRAEVSRGRGIVRDPEVWQRALGDVASAFSALGAVPTGQVPSPLAGADGNREFFLHLRMAG